MTEWVVLVNPCAGRRPVSVDEVEEALARAGVRSRVEKVEGIEAMRDAVRAVAASSARLAVVGGDGTVSLTVDTLLAANSGEPPLVGVLPAGTGCDLLRMFGIPQDLEAAARHLHGDADYLLDVACLEGEWGRRRFVNVAQAGVGAAAAETAPRLPRMLGAARYSLAFAARLPRFPTCEVTLTGPGWEYRGSALAVIFANAQFFAGGWNVAPKASIVDGLLDVQVFDATKTEAPGLVPKIVKGVHLGHRSVRRRNLGAFRLVTDLPWPVEVDGDYLGATPVTGSVDSGAVRLKI